MLPNRRIAALLLAFTAVLVTGCALTGGVTSSTVATLIASLESYTDSTGTISTYTSAGSIDESGVFFQTLGSNQRTCASCHQLNQGMSLNAASTAALFTSTSGTDPLFTAIDGANCPTATTGNLAEHSLITINGLIRIAITLPQTAQFTLSVVSDPYGCALSTSSTTGTQIVSVYRRPLPVTNLSFLSNVMWDTRETIDPLTSSSTFAANLDSDLNAQAITAVATHEQGTALATAAPTTAQLASLIAFIQTLSTAQATDTNAGSLSSNGGLGGAANLAAQNYYPGINDAFGQDPTGARFNPAVFNLYTAWNGGQSATVNASQASIARGEKLFNTAPLTITDVRGINDNTALGSPAALQGSCSTCHDTPNLGNHSLPLPMDTAIARQAADETDPGILAGLAQLATPSLPVYKITGCTDANNQPVTYLTSDPGKALTTGLCADVNRMKLPMLRGLAARAPYFHNGSASNLAAVVSFYNARFNMHLNAQQQTDLVNFLSAL